MLKWAVLVGAASFVLGFGLAVLMERGCVIPYPVLGRRADESGGESV